MQPSLCSITARVTTFNPICQIELWQSFLIWITLCCCFVSPNSVGIILVPNSAARKSSVRAALCRCIQFPSADVVSPSYFESLMPPTRQSYKSFHKIDHNMTDMRILKFASSVVPLNYLAFPSSQTKWKWREGRYIMMMPAAIGLYQYMHCNP